MFRCCIRTELPALVQAAVLPALVLHAEALLKAFLPLSFLLQKDLSFPPRK